MTLKIAAMLAMLFAAALLLGCAGDGLEKNTLRIAGPPELYPLLENWAAGYESAHPGATVAISAPDGGDGMEELLLGKADIAIIGRGLTDEEKAEGVQAIRVAQGAVVAVSNSENPANGGLAKTGIRREKLRLVFIEGKNATWVEIAGWENNHDARPYIQPRDGKATQLVARYLGGKPEAMRGMMKADGEGIADAIARDADGIGYVDSNHAYWGNGSVRYGLFVLPLDLDGNGALTQDEEFYQGRGAFLEAVGEGKYPVHLTYGIFAASKGGFSGEGEKFVQWALGEGQSYAPFAGFATRGNG